MKVWNATRLAVALLWLAGAGSCLLAGEWIAVADLDWCGAQNKVVETFHVGDRFEATLGNDGQLSRDAKGVTVRANGKWAVRIEDAKPQLADFKQKKHRAESALESKQTRYQSAQRARDRAVKKWNADAASNPVLARTNPLKTERLDENIATAKKELDEAQKDLNERDEALKKFSIAIGVAVGP